MLVVIAFFLGALTWTLAEYAVHRGLGHKSGLKNPFTVEHLAHHADTSYFAPTPKKLVAATIVSAIAGPSAFFLVASVRDRAKSALLPKPNGRYPILVPKFGSSRILKDFLPHRSV